MELFTMGVGFYTEPDVYAGARVFTGWNLRQAGATGAPATHNEFFYNAAQHDTTAKTFSFPIYADLSKTIPARAAADGMQDGLDLINALATNPNTGRCLAKKLYKFFISEFSEPDPAFIDQMAKVYLDSQLSIKAVLRALLHSPQFWDSSSYYARYSWPVEFVVRAIKEVGWRGFTVNDTLTPLTNMGQLLFEPPDVGGWNYGKNWFSTGAMLARMNFASALAANQKINLLAGARSSGKASDRLLAYYLGRLTPHRYDDAAYADLLAYAGSGAAWTGSDAQIQARGAGLVHLIVGSAEYQFV
jgi:uncharacterized protein (DUF1800 family)